MVHCQLLHFLYTMCMKWKAYSKGIVYLKAIVICSIRATCPTYLILLDFFIVIIFAEARNGILSSLLLLIFSWVDALSLALSLQTPSIYVLREPYDGSTCLCSLGWSAKFHSRIEQQQNYYFLRAYVFSAGWGTYPVGTGSYLPWGKGLGCIADHSHQTTAEVKNGGAVPPLPHVTS
jgi:hypothetical protein